MRQERGVFLRIYHPEALAKSIIYAFQEGNVTENGVAQLNFVEQPKRKGIDHLYFADLRYVNAQGRVPRVRVQLLRTGNKQPQIVVDAGASVGFHENDWERIHPELKAKLAAGRVRARIPFGLVVSWKRRGDAWARIDESENSATAYIPHNIFRAIQLVGEWGTFCQRTADWLKMLSKTEGISKTAFDARAEFPAGKDYQSTYGSKYAFVTSLYAALLKHGLLPKGNYLNNAEKISKSGKAEIVALVKRHFRLENEKTILNQLQKIIDAINTVEKNGKLPELEEELAYLP